MRRLSDTVAVAPQLGPEDVAEAAQAGVALIVNNRPDGEAPDQPPGAEIEAAARAAGVGYVAIPFTGKPGQAQVEAMAAALDGAGGPVLAFCKTGTRSAAAWAHVQVGRGATVDEVLRAAAEAGYDLKAWLP